MKITRRQLRKLLIEASRRIIKEEEDIPTLTVYSDGSPSTMDPPGALQLEDEVVDSFSPKAIAEWRKKALIAAQDVVSGLKILGIDASADKVREDEIQIDIAGGDISGAKLPPHIVVMADGKVVESELIISAYPDGTVVVTGTRD